MAKDKLRDPKKKKNKIIIVPEEKRKPIIIPQHFRERRRREIHKIYTDIMSTTLNEEEKIYANLKKYYDAEKMIELFYEILENNLSIILQKIQDIYKITNSSIINLEDILFNKDGKTLEERINNWFLLYEDPKEIWNLFSRLNAILETEKYHMIPKIIKLKVEVEYIEVFRNDEDCFSGVCEEYADEEAHFADDWEEPPYHTRCVCEAYFYTEEEIRQNLDDDQDPTI